jgi:hypothetical protein
MRGYEKKQGWAGFLVPVRSAVTFSHLEKELFH